MPAGGGEPGSLMEMSLEKFLRKAFGTGKCSVCFEVGGGDSGAASSGEGSNLFASGSSSSSSEKLLACDSRVQSPERRAALGWALPGSQCGQEWRHCAPARTLRRRAVTQAALFVLRSVVLASCRKLRNLAVPPRYSFPTYSWFVYQGPEAIAQTSEEQIRGWLVTGSSLSFEPHL